MRRGLKVAIEALAERIRTPRRIFPDEEGTERMMKLKWLNGSRQPRRIFPDEEGTERRSTCPTG